MITGDTEGWEELGLNEKRFILEWSGKQGARDLMGGDKICKPWEVGMKMAKPLTLSLL